MEYNYSMLNSNTYGNTHMISNNLNKKYISIFTNILIIFFILGSSIFCIYLYINNSYLYITTLTNFNNLISITIPTEINYIHDIMIQQNKTIVLIENILIKYLDNMNYIINEDTINNITNTIKNLNKITSQMNITLIQADLNNIATDLNKIIH